ncbi:RNA 2',3'-cyclic phosphodiesterase [Nocardioides sp. TF02-7]|uniref:RNA 2',3'-cyclic phosphodiesterase n=1 Tax=Nocardioides sp. TF02-7 TaxID=2917724 RepID=UPI001F06F9A8|nr:RNA 2',3'-cyclic phosphodiesterase [Nocardioides sp. TF02-7]UMG94501.1 RNA 2',3'-cyclic phosphodiesterase [Nocardioides sp. TF02-7]
MTLRLFAAIVPPPEAVDHLDAFLAPRRAAADFRWTARDHLHATLAFMARADEWRLEEYVERLAEALTGVPVPVVRLAGPVAFPNVAHAKVLATGVVAESEDADALLDRIAGKARSAAVRTGIEVDGQRFRPHVTLARTRPTEVSNWVRLLETYVGPAWPVTEVEVVSSHLGEGPRRAPRYETVAAVAVGR